MKPNSNYVKVVREEVDLSYDFPILTSSDGRYEAQINQRGELVLVPLL